MIPIYRPFLSKEILRYAYDALDSTWISSTGKYLQLAEDKLKELLKVNHVILTNNGTTATHLVSLGLTEHMHGKADLIVPNNSYVAAWNAFIYDKNFRLIPIDADLDTWNIDLTKLDYQMHKELREERDPLVYSKRKAVLIVHNLGNIINVPELKIKYPNAVFVEDACEGLFGVYESKLAGTASLLSSFSFYGNKTITSGEGGAVITNDDYLADTLRTLRGQGQSKTKFVHELLGYNYRMTNVAASILYGQLEALNTIIGMKLEVFTRYDVAFCQVPDIHLQQQHKNTVPANWMYGLRISKEGMEYSKAEQFFTACGIEIRPMFYPMSSHAHLASIAKVGNETVAKQLNKEVIILPSYPELTEQEQNYIIEKVKEFIDVL